MEYCIVVVIDKPKHHSFSIFVSHVVVIDKPKPAISMSEFWLSVWIFECIFSLRVLITCTFSNLFFSVMYMIDLNWISSLQKKQHAEETIEDCLDQENDKWPSVCKAQGTNGYTYNQSSCLFHKQWTIFSLSNLQTRVVSSFFCSKKMKFQPKEKENSW